MPAQIWFDIDEALLSTLQSLNGTTIFASSPLPDDDVVEGVAKIWTQINRQQNKGSVTVVFDVPTPQGNTQIRIYLSKDQVASIADSNDTRSRYIYPGLLIPPLIR